MESGIVSGQQTVWTLLDKLGEGDAGEVFRVESLLDGRQAILKRPHRSAFAGDVLRQSGQIRTEGKVLDALRAQFENLAGARLTVPRVLDESKPGSEFSGGQFIIIEEARGIDLGTLLRVSRFGVDDIHTQLRGVDQDDVHFLQAVSNLGKIPERTLLLALRSLIEMFDQIHQHPYPIDDANYFGLIWNDVKPDHIFWNLKQDYFTIIDWGNCQLLEEDGTTRDRRFSRLDDYRQFFEEMGRYLVNAAPVLHQRLNMPSLFTPGAFSDATLPRLKAQIDRALALENQTLGESRAHEKTLLAAGAKNIENLKEMSSVHDLILAHGALPDYPAALRFGGGLAVDIVQQPERLAEFDELCLWAGSLPGARDDAWELVRRLAPLAAEAPEATRALYLEALQAAITGAEYPEVLWKLAQALLGSAEPPWWYDISGSIRRMVLRVNGEDLRPLVAANRLMMGLRSMLRGLEDRARTVKTPEDDTRGVRELALISEAVRRMREEIIPAWTQLEPAPPYSGIAYLDLEELVSSLDLLQSADVHTLTTVMQAPHFQAHKVLDAWERKDFKSARVELGLLLVMDPERRRVLRADQALERAAQWLDDLQHGLKEEAELASFVTDMEFSGRELRNQVGPASWLDRILIGLQKLRRGLWPGDLQRGSPELLVDLPWLALYERQDAAGVPAAQPAELNGEENIGEVQPASVTGPVQGMKMACLGTGKDISLSEPLDAWAAEARGSSARVYSGLLYDPERDTTQEAAVKLMRMDKTEYALPLFREEILVLNGMKDVPGVNRLIECGFLEIGDPLPHDQDKKAIQSISGSAVRIGAESGQIFLNLLEGRVNEGWTPYLAIEKRKQDDNLINLCDAGRRQGHYRPVPELVRIAIQICEVLEAAHQRNIVYRDHKILHYYWQADVHSVYLIDWNVARYHADGLSDIERHMDLVQFAARGLHHILTGRVAPGALPLGPTQPEEIEAAAETYKTQWTYDDSRLSDELRELIERSLAGEYQTASGLAEDLKKAYINLMR